MKAIKELINDYADSIRDTAAECIDWNSQDYDEALMRANIAGELESFAQKLETIIKNQK